MKSWQDLMEAIVQGAVKRLRPKIMTVGVMFMGLLPIMWSTGTGANVMKRIAAPMIGGIFTSLWSFSSIRRFTRFGNGARK